MFIPDHFGAPGTSSPTIAAHISPVAWIRNKFLAGLALVTPLILTFWIMRFVYDTLHGYSEPVLQFIVTQLNHWFTPAAAKAYQLLIDAHSTNSGALVGAANELLIDPKSPGFILFESCIGVLIPVVVLIGLGLMATHVIGVRIVEAFDRLLLRIPFISFIYKSLRQVIDAFKKLGGKSSFKRVVYVDYPSPGMWMLAFVTGQFYDRHKQQSMTCIFLPTAPSPMTGLLLIVENARVHDAPMSIEEAMKMIFSGGLVGPDSDGVPRSDNSPPPASPEPPSPGETLPAGLPTADDADHAHDVVEHAATATVATTNSATGQATRSWPERIRMPWRKTKERV